MIVDSDLISKKLWYY